MDMMKALEAVESWPVDDQIEFVQRVWDKIAVSGVAPPLSSERRAELDRRLEKLRRHPDDVVTWESIVAHVRPRE